MATLNVGGTTASYTYNALGEFVKQSGGPSGTVLYLYDEAGHLLGEYDSSGNLIEETVWMGDIPIATLRPGSPVAIYYVHTDHLKTPRRVTRPSDNKLMCRRFKSCHPGQFFLFYYFSLRNWPTRKAENYSAASN